MLRRNGIDSELRIGVRRGDGAFQAHSWVEYAGLVLNDWEGQRREFRAFGRSIALAG